MRGRNSNAGQLLLLLGALATLSFAIGCGSSDGNAITVQTGSLSKAAFIKKADAICEAAREELLTKFFAFLKAHKAIAGRSDAQSSKVVATGVVNSVLTPNIEGEIEQISKLGAPEDYAPEVASFLDALDERLARAQENPTAISATTEPFKDAADVAKRSGLIGCSESFG
jgi:hypothetical protein